MKEGGGRNSVQLDLLSQDYIETTFNDSDINNFTLDSNVPYRKILIIILYSNLWTLVLTVLPVLVNIPPNNYYARHHDWYTGDDVIRFIEPIGGLPLNFLVLYKSGIFETSERTIDNYTIACLTIFFFGAAIYGQGAGFHSASNMYKNALETLPAQDDQVEDLHYYMRTVWEHDVSHYLYAVGLVLMHACQAYAYRNVKAPQLGLTKVGKALLCLSSLVLGLLVAGVAIEFPAGTVVGLIYLVLYGIGVVGGYLLYQQRQEEDKTGFCFGQKPVLHHFFFGYVVGLIILIAWIIAVGGFKSRSEAGY